MYAHLGCAVLVGWVFCCCSLPNKLLGWAVSLVLLSCSTGAKVRWEKKLGRWEKKLWRWQKVGTHSLNRLGDLGVV